MKKSYLILAASYSDTVGGVIALHKLCHVLNSIGETALLVPPLSSYDTSLINKKRVLGKLRKELRRWKSSDYVTNPKFNTPVIKKTLPKLRLEDYIVVYPDVISGNPLCAPHVVRWFLHSPGHHMKEIHYRTDELHFDYNNFLKIHRLPAVKISSTRLYLTHTPTELYNLDNALPDDKRSGTAYCLRKGKGREIVHDIANSVLIDDMPHDEIANIFKRIKTFISYDTYTSYNVFAALSGADSVVVPEQGISKNDWHPDAKDHYGIAYGFDDIPSARKTRPLLLKHIQEREAFQQETVGEFAGETQRFFS